MILLSSRQLLHALCVAVVSVAAEGWRQRLMVCDAQRARTHSVCQIVLTSSFRLTGCRQIPTVWPQCFYGARSVLRLRGGDFGCALTPLQEPPDNGASALCTQREGAKPLQPMPQSRVRAD